MDDNNINNISLAMHRLSRAKQDVSDAELCYQNNRYLVANNRAYYAIFHAIRAVFALERVDFKRHKDVIAHFNQYYIKSNVFPRIIGKKISQASSIREDSDYDDEFIAKEDKTKEQIETAKELIELVEKYINKMVENS